MAAEVSDDGEGNMTNSKAPDEGGNCSQTKGKNQVGGAAEKFSQKRKVPRQRILVSEKLTHRPCNVPPFIMLGQ